MSKTSKKTDYLEIEIFQENNGDISLNLRTLPDANAEEAAKQLNRFKKIFRNQYPGRTTHEEEHKNESYFCVVPCHYRMGPEEFLRTFKKMISRLFKISKAGNWTEEVAGHSSPYITQYIGADDAPESIKHSERYRNQILKNPGPNRN